MSNQAVHPFIRDTYLGRLVYHFSHKRVFRHPEEMPDYTIPEKYLQQKDDEKVIVGWEGKDDPESPRNWPSWMRQLYVFEIGLLTMIIFLGPSIQVPAMPDFKQEFHASRVETILPLSLMMFGYSFGPLLFGPLSENPSIGRIPIFAVTVFLYAILQIPLALSKNIATILVLRFLSGLFASPSLSNGPACASDVVPLSRMPIGLLFWSFSAVCGPFFGPLIGSGLQPHGWRWIFWFLLIVTGAALAMVLLGMPETSERTLLYRKAQRLRKVTGNPNIVAQSELQRKTFRQIAWETFWRPIEILIADQSILAIDLLLALCYSTFFCFFESIPIIYGQIYGFTPAEQGCVYFSNCLGIITGGLIYLYFAFKKYIRPLEAGQKVTPDVLLPLCLGGAIVEPAGVFITAWSSTKDAHWMGPTVGLFIYAAAAFVMFQSMYNYLGASFPRYVASVFAGNTLLRCGMAAAFPIFAAPMFNSLGPDKFPVGWGTSVLAFALLALAIVPYILIKFGYKLRANSKYAN